MIELINVSKSYRTNKGRKHIFKNLSFSVPSDRNIALIGKNGAGKSTLMRLLGGLDTPDQGKILTDKSISWPVGLSGGFQGSLTGRQNVKFVARVHGAHATQMRAVLESVERFADIGAYFDQPVNTYSTGMRARVAFGLSLAFQFDYYLVDEAMSVGDASFKQKAAEAFKRRIESSKIILVTHSMSQVRDLCDLILIVRDGRIEIFEDIDKGISTYGSL